MFLESPFPVGHSGGPRRGSQAEDKPDSECLQAMRRTASEPNSAPDTFVYGHMQRFICIGLLYNIIKVKPDALCRQLLLQRVGAQ